MAEASSRMNPSAVDNAPSTTPTGTGFRRLRIWPAVVLLAVLWLAKSLPLFTDELGMWGFMLIAWSPLVCAVGIAIWWLFASRARITERLLGLVGLMAVAVA